MNTYSKRKAAQKQHDDIDGLTVSEEHKGLHQGQIQSKILVNSLKNEILTLEYLHLQPNILSTKLKINGIPIPKVYIYWSVRDISSSRVGAYDGECLWHIADSVDIFLTLNCVKFWKISKKICAKIWVLFWHFRLTSGRLK